MSRYYEITDGNLHVGWASEDYIFTKMDERVLKGEANFNFHVGDRDAVDVVPVKHGHWYDEPNYLGTSRTMYFCSYCGSASWREDPYCWHCGSKMEESNEQDI